MQFILACSTNDGIVDGAIIWLRRTDIESIEEYDIENELAKVGMRSGDVHIVRRDATDIVIAAGLLAKEGEK